MVDVVTAPHRAPVPAGVGAPLSVSVLEAEPHLPGWAEADPAWSPLLLGWSTPDGRPVADSLVLRRSVPGSGRFLALLPEPPRLGGRELEPALWRPQAVGLLRALGAFAVRIGLGAPKDSHGGGSRPRRWEPCPATSQRRPG